MLNRKLGRDGGATMETMQAEIRDVVSALKRTVMCTLNAMGDLLAEALVDHVATTQGCWPRSPRIVFQRWVAPSIT